LNGPRVEGGLDLESSVPRKIRRQKACASTLLHVEQWPPASLTDKRGLKVVMSFSTGLHDAYTSIGTEGGA
jgi:hypothetical protein